MLFQSKNIVPFPGTTGLGKTSLSFLKSHLYTERLQDLPGVFSFLHWTTLLDFLCRIAVPALWQFSFRSLGKQTFQLFLQHHSLITQEAPQKTSSLLWKPTNYHRNQRQNVFYVSLLTYSFLSQYNIQPIQSQEGKKKRKKEEKKKKKNNKK